MIVRLAAFVAVFIVVTVPALADPVGRYTVEGKNPGGGPSCSGTVSVERTDRLTGLSGTSAGAAFGTGVGNKDFLAVSYRSGSSTGLALYGEVNGSWVGIWAYADGQDLGAERWTRR